jgi:uncharacterized repeat protein (TIGR03803 family)
MSIATRLVIATVAAGAVAPVVADAGTFTTLSTFKTNVIAAYPVGPLTYHNGFLYGTGVTVYKVNVATGKVKLVLNFDLTGDGGAPLTGVIYHHGILYGTTSGGGAQGEGSIFAIGVKARTEKVLYSFDYQANPGGLIYVDGFLYGTTSAGGTAGDGTIFRINPKTGNLATLHNFGSGGDGSDPNAQLLYHNGLLFGTTEFGGVSGFGTVFSFDPTTSTESVLHAFSSTKGGKFSTTNLVYHSGSLISDTVRGGDEHCAHRIGCGVTFAIKSETGNERILDDLGPGGTLPSGGTGGYGQLVQVDLKTGQQTVLYTFSGGADGSDPEAPLTYHDGAFYGTTYRGGAGIGTVFKYVP